MNEFSHQDIKKAIHKSQHCQRNWDLSREMPPADIDLLITAATQCPSKQNVAYYKVHFVTNRELIEKIHNQTNGFTVSYEPLQTTTNTQVLANLLVVFEEADIKLNSPQDVYRNLETKEFADKGTDASALALELLMRDKNMAVGVAAGYLNLTAGLLGYSTGCCACFYPQGVKEILKLEKAPLLLMGIGFGNTDLSRRAHHLDPNFIFPTKGKQPIEVNIVK